MVELGEDEGLTRDVLLKLPVARLGEVRVTDTASLYRSAKLAGFDERRHRRVGGHFIDQAMIEKWESRRTGDLLSTLSGVDVRRAGMKSYAAGNRTRFRGGSACYMDVYLDGIPVYVSGSRGGTPPFDVNSIGLAHIAGIEVYTGMANTPAQSSRSGSGQGCGVILIWTR